MSQSEERDETFGNKVTYLDNLRSKVQPKTNAPKARIEVAKVTQGSQWLGEKIALPTTTKQS